jgi:tetratricopeptide (TPR) repeat protein
VSPLSPEEMLRRLQAAREAGGGKPGSAERVRLHRALAAEAPAFVPNLLELGRGLQIAEDGVGEDTFDEAEAVLQQAVAVSQRSAPTLVELAYFLNVIRDAPQQMEPLLEEAIEKTLHLMEDAWAGLINVLVEQEKYQRALEVSERARRVFPDSVRIAMAAESAEAQAVHEGLLPPRRPEGSET